MNRYISEEENTISKFLMCVLKTDSETGIAINATMKFKLHFIKIYYFFKKNVKESDY